MARRPMTRVLLHYGAGPRWRDELVAVADQNLQVDICDEADDELFYSLLPDAEVLWHALRPISASDIEKARSLRLIQKIGIGVNTIDVDAASRQGIAVCNMPGTNSQAVAEMALLLMLACLRRLPVLDRATRAARGWALDKDLLDRFGEIGGRRVGLVGYGAVARALTPALQGLGAKVSYTASAPKAEVNLEFVSLHDLLQRSDIVSLHTPLTEENKGMLGAAEIALMPPGSILVNTARGGLVDQDALTEALMSGHLAAAGLDVFETEPLVGNERLLQLENVVVTPHLGWLTNNTLDRSMSVALENVRRLESGAELLHQVV